jgi:iron complex transport system substrate-binding protein
LNRASRGLLALLLSLSLILAACGDSPTGTTGTTTAPAVTTAPATAAQFPMTITDATGTTITIPKKVERIFCFPMECYEVLLQLGMEPVGVLQVALDYGNSYFNSPQWFGNLRDKLPRVSGTGTEPSLEDIAKLKPDLIFGASYSANLREGLKNIAPLYVQKGGDGTLKGIYDNFRDIAKVTGREAQAETYIKKFEERLATYQAKSPKNVTSLLVWSYALPPLIATNRSPQGVIFSGVTKYPWEILPGADAWGSVTYSVEKILQVDPDVLFVRVSNPKTATADILSKQNQSREQLLADPVLKELKAVKTKRVYEIMDYQMGGSFMGYNALLDEIMTKTYPEVFPKALS